MKHLDPDFRDSIFASIDKSGNVVVGGMPFTPVGVLTANADAYKEAFLSWLNDVWIPSKQDVLGDVLKDRINKQRYGELLAAVKAQQVVPFIGSGMSSPSGMPLWSGFLRDLQKVSTMPLADLDALLAAGQYEEAAERLLVAMPMHLFNERLEQTFLARTISEIAGSVRFIPEIFDDTFITTNFDNVLELVSHANDQPFEEILKGASIEQFRMMRGRGKRCLLKVHGDHMNPQGRVLTRAEYDAAYGPGCAARTELQYVFGSEPLLFLGCSLYEDRTMQLLKEVVTADPNTPKNYAFMKRPSDPAALVLREHFLTDRKIFAIWYDGDHDESIEALFYGMLHELGKV